MPLPISVGSSLGALITRICWSVCAGDGRPGGDALATSVAAYIKPPELNACTNCS
jgi:hypothetical protein